NPEKRCSRKGLNCRSKKLRHRYPNLQNSKNVSFFLRFLRIPKIAFYTANFFQKSTEWSLRYFLKRGLEFLPIAANLLARFRELPQFSNHFFHLQKTANRHSTK